MRERMGADLMVTPQNTKNQAEALLTGNSSSTFYFTNDIGSQIAEADGVGESTVQTYISSLAAACCDERCRSSASTPTPTSSSLLGWLRNSTAHSVAAKS